MPTPLRVAVTGAAGNIGYSLLWRIASGSCFGSDQPIELRLLEIPAVMERLEGTAMELTDSAFPLVDNIVLADDPKVAFDGADRIFLVGSRPRTATMDRSDLVAANGPIFVGQGKAINDRASSDVRVLVVGNPCNTNCLIAQRNAPDVPAERFTAMTRLDHNRALGQLAKKVGVSVRDIEGVAIWGNHSDKMYADTSRATINGKPVSSILTKEWLYDEFMKTVATRGKAVIKARGASSAASAASAAHDHMRDWHNGAKDVVSMAVFSQGQYDVPEGLIFSFPCTVDGGQAKIVSGWDHNDFGHVRLQSNVTELLAESEAVSDLI